MIDNYNLILLSGGYHECDAAWNKSTSGIDRCYKVYFPISGSVCLETGPDSFVLESGKAYLISGFRLTRQSCPEMMKVYWLHFVPESLYFRHLLDQLPAVSACPMERAGWSNMECREICEIFQSPFSDHNLPRSDCSAALDCRIHGLLLVLISRLLELLDDSIALAFRPEFFLLKPAIDFMQMRILDNPPLAVIAETVGMAPNYFHRRFTGLFGITPFEHMLRQRMDCARRFLTSSALSIKEVAAKVGYADAAYFSRIFSRRMGISPIEYRTCTQDFRFLTLMTADARPD